MIRLKFPPHHRSPDALAGLVAGWHGVSLADLTSQDPHPRLAAARQDLILILTENTGLTLEQIGVALGDRSASTIHGLHRAAKRAEALHPETRLRLVSLRSAALALPGGMAAALVVPCAPSEIAHAVIAAPIQEGMPAFDRLAVGVVTAVAVLRDPNLSAEDARRAAFCLLTSASGRVSAVIPESAEIQIINEGIAQ